MKKIRIFLLVTILFLQAGCNINAFHKAGLKVGFDVDDTLLFSSPAFDQAYSSGARPYSEDFWKVVNSSDEKFSKVKKKAESILLSHQGKGAEIYIITARHPSGGDVMKGFLKKRFNIPEENIFFETEGKSGRMKMLNLEMFYGDSDSDIQDAMIAGVKPIRIQRAAESSYTKDYNPGKFSEKIIRGSQW